MERVEMGEGLNRHNVLYRAYASQKRMNGHDSYYYS